MVAEVFLTPYDKPCDIDNTAPEPGEMAISQQAAKKVNQVWKFMIKKRGFNGLGRNSGGYHRPPILACAQALQNYHRNFSAHAPRRDYF
jgi:hypothetical protein